MLTDDIGFTGSNNSAHDKSSSDYNAVVID